MDHRWLKNLEGKERDELQKSIRSSKIMLDKLSEIVYTISESRNSPKASDYDSPSWAYLQAHNNGYLEACRHFQTLLDLKEPTNG